MKQRGFTMIELIMVIVILGILAATALPKFANLQKEARQSNLDAAEGAVKSAMGIVYSQSLIEGEESDPTGSVDVSGVTINTVYGYPSAADIDDAAGLDDTYTNSSSNDTDASGNISISGRTNCQFTYTAATSATAPATVGTQTTSGC